VSLIYIDESHFHQDLDGGSTWSKKGTPAWRPSTSPVISDNYFSRPAIIRIPGP
jgi:hypothetical protein